MADQVVVVIHIEEEYQGELPWSAYFDELPLAGPWPTDVYANCKKIADALAYVAVTKKKHYRGVDVNGQVSLIIVDSKTFKGVGLIKRIVWDAGGIDEEVLKELVCR